MYTVNMLLPSIYLFCVCAEIYPLFVHNPSFVIRKQRYWLRVNHTIVLQLISNRGTSCTAI